jgi:hypothetical protein
VTHGWYTFFQTSLTLHSSGSKAPKDALEVLRSNQEAHFVDLMFLERHVVGVLGWSSL